MVLKREDHLKAVIDGLGRIVASCQLRAAVALLDINVVSHHFFAQFLSALYGLRLEVMDRIQANFPAVDLGDDTNRVAYQVTSDKDGRKVQHTLDMFVKKELHKRFDKVKILILGERGGK